MISKKEIKDKIFEVLSNSYNLSILCPLYEYDVVKDLKLDEWECCEYFMELEKIFGITIPYDVQVNYDCDMPYTSINSLITYIYETKNIS